MSQRTLTEMEKQQARDHAVAADRLRQDPAFQRAVLAMRKDAVERLILADASDANAITTHQAYIKAIDNLCEEIAMTIMRAPRETAAVT